MRHTVAALLVFVLCGVAANAQKLSLLPQVGLENPLTRVSYNDLPYFTPVANQLAPNFGVMLDYKFKKGGHGPYVGISTTKSGVDYSFSNPETGMNVFEATSTPMRFGFQAGYKVSSNPITLGKSKAPAPKAEQPKTYTKTVKTGCGTYKVVTYTCEPKKTTQPQTKPKESWVKIQPSAGVVFSPKQDEVVVKSNGTQNLYTYNAGNYATAFTAGTGFEFGKGSRRNFTVSVNYYTGLGDQSSTFTTTDINGKTTTTSLSSKTSGWNATLGIPFTLNQKKSPKQKKAVEEKKTEKKCGDYKYKSRCRVVS